MFIFLRRTNKIEFSILIWLFLFLIIETGYSQYYEVSRYADDSGLPSRIVKGVSQDPKGFLWVAGNNGLYKFDGQKFRPYYASLKDTTGLRDNKINAVLAASNGTVWIATPKGLHVLQNDVIEYVALTDNSSSSQSHVIGLFEDSAKNIWVSTYDGLFIVESETGNVLNFSEKENNNVRDNTFWSVTEDHKGRIWACRSGKPPLLIEKETYRFKELSFNLTSSVKDKDITPLKYVQYNDSIILMSSGLGLLKASYDNDSTLTVSRFYTAEGTEAAGDYIYGAIVDSDQNIWTATWKNRFKKYRIVDGALIEQEVISRNGLLNMSGHARNVYEDSQKNIWISNSNGLYKLSENKGKIFTFPPSHIDNCFEDLYSIYGMAEDKGGYLWITTPRDLYRFKKEDLLTRDCPTAHLQFKNIHFQRARDIMVDTENRLWVSGPEGISISQLDANYNPGKFFHLTAANGLPHKWSNGVYQADKNTFWVGNYTRLVKITFPDGNHLHPEISTYNSSNERDDALVNSYTLDIEADKNGAIWIGTFSGLSKLNSEEEEGTFTNYTSVFGQYDQLTNNAIKKIFKDSKGRLWIGTQTGLNLFIEATNNFLQLGREEGLPSEYILGIEEDSSGNLWVATTRGLMKAVYNDSMESFVHIEYYTTRDGLADNITNLRALYIDDDDNVFIGSANALSILGRSKTSIEAREFRLALTTVESTQKQRQGFVSVKNVINDNTIKLPHRENSIKLSYAALDFTDPVYNRYRHKFLPVNEDWIHTGSTSELTYYNLSPGEYEFILDGSNNQGIWAQEPIQLKVIIAPPFWKSNLAFLLYFILGGILLRFLYMTRIRKRERELEQEAKLEKALVQEREQLRKENTADFHDELGSKVTKISLFLTLAERSLKERKDPSEWFAKIRNNIKDLSGGFRDLLWVIDPQKDSLSDAFLRLKDFGEDLFNQTEIDFRTTGYEVSQMQLLLDPQTKKQVVMIFKEAMNNCLKYADCSTVVLNVTANEQYSNIILKDDGKGFNVVEKSKGRGLKNMIDRAKKIGAEIDITSSQLGTSILLKRIPHSSDDYHLEAM